MFPFQQGEEYSSQIFHNPQPENIGEEDVMLGVQVDQRHLTNLVEETNQIFGAPPSSNSNALLSNDERKIFRKETERQRRQHLSTLHASLRSLLPFELIKGKRSMSDHLDGAVTYIHYLKKNIQDLSAKRDKLKRLSDSTNSFEDQRTDSSEKTMHVSVRSYLDGAEIIISSDYGEKGFVLSRLVEAVLEERLDIESCFSTQKDGKQFTTIHCQANDAGCIDHDGIQQKLYDVILCLKDSAKE